MSVLWRGLAVACAFELAVVPKLSGPPGGHPAAVREAAESSFNDVDLRNLFVCSIPVHQRGVAPHPLNGRNRRDGRQEPISQRTEAPWPAAWKARTLPDDVAEHAWRHGPG